MDNCIVPTDVADGSIQQGDIQYWIEKVDNLYILILKKYGDTRKPRYFRSSAACIEYLEYVYLEDYG
jgi:hypothetical protein